MSPSIHFLPQGSLFYFIPHTEWLPPLRVPSGPEWDSNVQCTVLQVENWNGAVRILGRSGAFLDIRRLQVGLFLPCTSTHHTRLTRNVFLRASCVD